MGGSLRKSKTDLSDANYSIRTGGVGRGGSPIRQLLNTSGLVGSHSHTKRVPAIVMQAGPDAWCAFLSGYLDTDGSVGGAIGATQQPKVYWSSTSRELLDDCQHLLALLGINSSVFVMSEAVLAREVCGQTCEARASWGLFVTGREQLKQLADLLTPEHSVKAERLSKFRDLPTSNYRKHCWDFDRVRSVE
jgi:hypothetical protein